MKKYAGLLYVPLLIAGWAAPDAFAQTSGAIETGAMQYTLVDLAPDDGLAPSLTWVDYLSESSITLGLQRGNVAGTPTYIKSFEAKDTNTSGLGAPTSVSTTGLKASTLGSALSVDLSIPSGASAGVYAVHGRHFQLGPHTSVTFTASVVASTTGTTPDFAPEPNGYFDWAYYQTSATARLGHWIDNEYGWGPEVVFGSATVGSGIRSTQLSHNDTGHQSGMLSRTVVNDTAGVFKDNIAVLALVSAYTVVPVPEAGTPQLLALGLAAMGAVTVRRQRRARRAHADMPA